MLSMSEYYPKEIGMTQSDSSAIIDQTNPLEIITEKKQTPNLTKIVKPGLSLMPSTSKTFKRTTRLIFDRRMNFMDRPLIIICFQGCLGDF